MTPKKLKNYSYYPGCSLHASGREYDISTRALFKALNIGLKEVPDWFCCGATPAHNVDELLSLSLCAKNLVLAEEVEGDLAVACAACFSRLKTTQHHLKVDDEKRAQVEKAIAGPATIAKPVKHILEILVRDLGLAKLEESVKKPLFGLKVACYYGCLLTRPPEVPELDDCEDPSIMEDLLRALGAEPVSWSHRMECCGANFTLSRPDVVLHLSDAILRSAQAAGADCVMVACPLCHGNLDIRQEAIENRSQEKYDLPIFYITQLAALAMGVDDDKLGFDSVIVDPRPMLMDKELI
ncbi:CoB--CoM heterodisulfide reductase iron-sulfur subunit B family protein [Geomesophilobacter sediminis]|uniref:CoB--CoM heterodisulfide reductase iron-sulfur subunit B family protein n=1 Tax=Geomesophilobacter sediminis TaxID=2798584 RepID=A0A8J7LWR7_9BACT|nr:CoB--CoM heterodisulfide reductase iron-sulfur subunit B family protein [Geomesophilobacter sediminis]MBJ6726160.1 CoB--CoM heterodisulfide reductase iron-sulfur subunit B family protein [Geomesophilobacter sediminis]